MSNPRAAVHLGLVVLSSLLLSTLVGCDKQEQASAQSAPRTAAPAPVAVAKVTQRDVPVQIKVIGNVEAYSTVIVKSRVTGELQKVHVAPGQDVKTGELLFEIDPRWYEAAVHEAEARLERDTALAKNTQIDATRVQALLANNAATREEADKAKYAAEAAQATVRADQAAVETAKLELTYTKIASPIVGRAGALLANQGNVIKSDDTQLLTLNQVEPIYVTFNVPEQDLPQVRKFSATTQPSVDVTLPSDAAPSETGKLTFIDNLVDQDTGTIRLRATFENKDRQLWPGQFVQVALNLTVDANAIVIPSRAVQPGQDGMFVFVVRDDMTAQRRFVKIRRAIGEESVIEGDVLKPGEQVVTDGQLRLTPDAKVQIITPTTAPTAASKDQKLSRTTGETPVSQIDVSWHGLSARADDAETSSSVFGHTTHGLKARVTFGSPRTIREQVAS